MLRAGLWGPAAGGGDAALVASAGTSALSWVATVSDCSCSETKYAIGLHEPPL